MFFVFVDAVFHEEKGYGEDCYAFDVSEDVEELEELDLYEDEWESGRLDNNNLNDAKNGKVVAIIC